MVSAIADPSDLHQTATTTNHGVAVNCALRALENFCSRVPQSLADANLIAYLAPRPCRCMYPSPCGSKLDDPLRDHSDPLRANPTDENCHVAIRILRGNRVAPASFLHAHIQTKSPASSLYCPSGGHCSSQGSQAASPSPNLPYWMVSALPMVRNRSPH